MSAETMTQEERDQARLKPKNTSQEQVSDQQLITTSPPIVKTEEEIRLENELKEQQGEIGRNFKLMMGKLGDEYFSYISKYAKSDEYTFTLKKPTGNKIKDPITDEEIDEFAGWETKTFKRQKITTKEYQNVEALRGKYNAAKDDPEEIYQILSKMYRYLAYIYLQLPESDFNRADWDEIKPALDACNFSTVYSLRARDANPKTNQAVM